MKEIIYVKNKERKNIISNVRIKAQKLDQDEYEISRNDCKEFIRIVKRFSSKIDKNDLLKYCKKQHIALSE
ncbi:hypothetical protein PFAG_05289 [Plasmodium falciparum Santa Lucia]|uniref:Uncharacterized protein n=1 Tax=Plasmodium falciparum Santa Lucia TaxID=478859 RepID=W7FGU3_PLAFA|nr:hypothetical protein PFAG_05289 [Plasmodium falciparum Santa Lucia]